MPKIIIREGESLDNALRRFKKDVNNSGVLEKVRDRESYMNPAMKKKVKRERNAKRAKGHKGR